MRSISSNLDQSRPYLDQSMLYHIILVDGYVLTWWVVPLRLDKMQWTVLLLGNVWMVIYSGNIVTHPCIIPSRSIELTQVVRLFSVGEHPDHILPYPPPYVTDRERMQTTTLLSNNLIHWYGKLKWWCLSFGIAYNTYFLLYTNCLLLHYMTSYSFIVNYCILLWFYMVLMKLK